MKPIRCAHGQGPGIPCEGCAASRFREVQSPRGKYDLLVARLWSEHEKDLEVPMSLRRHLCCNGAHGSSGHDVGEDPLIGEMP